MWSLKNGDIASFNKLKLLADVNTKDSVCFLLDACCFHFNKNKNKILSFFSSFPCGFQKIKISIEEMFFYDN